MTVLTVLPKKKKKKDSLHQQTASGPLFREQRGYLIVLIINLLLILEVQ